MTLKDVCLLIRGVDVLMCRTVILRILTVPESQVSWMLTIELCRLFSSMDLQTFHL